MDTSPRARLNRLLGWALILAAFAWATQLDPWSLSERNPSLLVGSPRMLARHAQAVMLAMGFLQFIVALILDRRRRRGVGSLADLLLRHAPQYAHGAVLRGSAVFLA
jgi:hypothetical protein